MLTLLKKRDPLALTALLALLAILTAFLVVKIVTFRGLGYSVDLFSHIGIARGWLQGRPAMHENQFGYHNELHNYFLDLLMGPAVLAWGGYGIFICQFALNVAAVLYTFPILYAARDDRGHRLRCVLLYLVVFCGPQAFWIYHNAYWGFHVEMLYVPLGFILAVSLYKRHRWVSAVAAVLIVLGKEDGAVLVACIHLLYFALQWSAGALTRRQWLKLSLLWGCVWSAVFAAGLVYLRAQSAGRFRVTTALANLFGSGSPGAGEYFLPIAANFGLMLLPLAGALLWMRVLRAKAWLAWLVFMLPVTVVNLVSGLWYYPNAYFSLVWVPRFCLTFSLFLTMASLSLVLFSGSWFRGRRAQIGFGLAVAAALVFLQRVAVAQGDFSWLSLPTFASSGGENGGSGGATRPPEEPDPWQDARRLSRVLPEMYPLAVPRAVFGYFHRQDIVWLDHIPQAWVPPRMILLAEKPSPRDPLPDVLRQPRLVDTGRVRVYYEPQERHYLVAAGILPAEDDADAPPAIGSEPPAALPQAEPNE